MGRNLLRASICVWAASQALAQVSLKGNVLTVQSADLAATFKAAALVSLQNLLTGEQYIAQPGSSWFSLNMLDPIDRAMTAGQWQIVNDPATGATMGTISYQDATRQATLKVGVDPASGELLLRVGGQSSLPGVQSVFWGMFGLDFDHDAKLIVPGQAGEYFSRNSVTNALGLDYPTHWESQFVVYQAPQGSLLFYAHDTTPQFKRVEASHESGNLDLGFEMFAVAPWPDATSTPQFEWRLKGFAGDWKAPASYYKNWWSQAGPQNAVAPPDWVKDIRATVDIMYLDQPALQALAQVLDPSKTLLYVVPWRADGYDINYPDYTPSPDATAYVALAHKLGFHVMLHASALGVSETNENYPAMQPYQLKSADSLEPMGWLLNLDPGDIHRIAYINPSYDGYRKLFIDNIRPAIEALQPDAIHLDAGGTIVNDGNGLLNGENTIQGMIQLQQDLKAAFPNLALGYESTTEINYPFIQFAERWSENVSPHPISTFLFGDTTFFYGFLDQPNPEQDAFIGYLETYEGQGILPMVPVSSVLDFDPANLRSARTLRQLRLWQDREFVPDWNNDWNGALFQYRSLVDGGTAALTTDGQTVTLNVDGNPFYTRIENSAQFATSSYIQNWPAYSDSTLFGLDPTTQYWLEPNLQQPGSLPHLSGVPSNIKVDTGTFVGSDFALFSMATNQPPSFDFVGGYSTAAKGTTFLNPMRDRGLIFGATSTITPVFVGGSVSNSTLVLQPPYLGPIASTWGGVTWVQYSVPLPNTDLVRFSFQVAVPDSVVRTDPVTFVVWINGKEKWRTSVRGGAWNPASIDLSEFRGQTVTIRLIGAPGPRNYPVFAYACWSKLAIVTNPDSPGSQFTLNVSASASPTITGGTSTAAGAPDPSQPATLAPYQVTMDVPGSLLVFVQPPASIQLGTDLLDVPYTKFSSTYSSLPQPYVTDQNGQIIQNPGLGGATIPRAIFTNPAHNGRVYLTWAATLPSNAASLNILYGLMDPPPYYGNITIPYSGVDVYVFVNGQQQFDSHIQSAGANNGAVDLTKWAGQAVVIQIAIDADGTAIYDWGLIAQALIQ